ncbi:hypothetical protein AKJ43_03265 [candidate division MSBL1 archaeon SCGC-AAA261D19]|uniref:ABC transporter domain-containing protein n=1 Tax=candidate division MSBL1 archaeon SCGC-AAA261D19 TaxID=1698273 RepID=A0A133V587_9EURY|nr:hypothetical protein AKJ43_03265 [candidate division MSBL1 archaeon SCGC-AAA261D19]
MTLLEISNLEKNFGRNRVLEGLNLSIRKSEVFSILGPNASGKTTLLKIVSTIYKPTSGKVVVMGNDVQEDSSSVRRCIGFVGHDSYLYPELTAKENLDYYSKAYGIEDRGEVIKERLELVGMYHRMNDKVEEFSRGMEQRVSIARALLHDPSMLILDEPHTGLDLEAQRDFLNMIKVFVQDRGPVLMSSHDPRDSWKISHRVGILYQGRIEHIFKTRERKYGELEKILDTIKWRI